MYPVIAEHFHTTEPSKHIPPPPILQRPHKANCSTNKRKRHTKSTFDKWVTFPENMKERDYRHKKEFKLIAEFLKKCYR
jgi:hypothetical protein